MPRCASGKALTENVALEKLVELEHSGDHVGTDNPDLDDNDENLTRAVAEVRKNNDLTKADSDPTEAEVVAIFQQYRAANETWKHHMKLHDKLKHDLTEATRATNVENFKAYLEETAARAVFIATARIRKEALANPVLKPVLTTICNYAKPAAGLQVNDQDAICKALKRWSKRTKYIHVTRENSLNTAAFKLLTTEQQMYQITLVFENESRDRYSAK